MTSGWLVSFAAVSTLCASPLALGERAVRDLSVYSIPDHRGAHAVGRAQNDGNFAKPESDARHRVELPRSDGPLSAGAGPMRSVTRLQGIVQAAERPSLWPRTAGPAARRADGTAWARFEWIVPEPSGAPASRLQPGSDNGHGPEPDRLILSRISADRDMDATRFMTGLTLSF